MRYTLFLFFLIFWTKIDGQEKYPAGVSTPLIWIKNEGNSTINTHPSIEFSPNNPNLKWVLSQEQAEKISLFIVYKSNSSDEQILWNLSENNQQKIVATTQRITDYTASQHRVYPQKTNNERVKIHYYQHYKTLSDNNNQRAENEQQKSENYILNIGKKLDNFPPISLGGDIAEIILYDRVLSSMEMQQVASYLGIKYGVSLHQFQFKNYYDSEKNLIWDYNTHKEFNQNITALGKDFNGNIAQSKSQNSNDEHIISMEILKKNEANFPNQNFIFWSDNGKNLEIKKRSEGQPNGIARVWQLDFNTPQKYLQWVFNPTAIGSGSQSQVAKNNNTQNTNSEMLKAYYWLVIDSSATASFSPKNTQYIRLNELENTRPISLEFPNLQESQSLHYTIWTAPEMFSHLDIDQGKCKNQEYNRLQFNIIGGTAPYQISLKNIEDNSFTQTWKQYQNKGEKVLELVSGQYAYEVRDAQNKVYQQTLFLTDEDAQKPDFNEEYFIQNPILLEPKKSLPNGNYTFEWYQNGNLISKSSAFLLSEKGDYELRLISSNGCTSISKFSAFSDMDTQKGMAFILYPNPSQDGNFSIMASFPKITSGTLEIHSAEGRLVKSQPFYNEKQLQYHDNLPVSGVYFITLKTTFGRETKKLLIGH